MDKINKPAASLTYADYLCRNIFKCYSSLPVIPWHLVGPQARNSSLLAHELGKVTDVSILMIISK